MEPNSYLNLVIFLIMLYSFRSTLVILMAPCLIKGRYILKLGRFKSGEQIFYGRVEGDKVFEINSLFEEQSSSGPSFSIDELELLSPVCPGKVVCVGKNYREHIKEMGHQEVPEEPILFMKPPGAVIGPGGNIIYPSMSTRVDYEGELAAVMGKKCRKVTPDEAANFILGYTCANDVTARDLQLKDGQWTRAKSFDTFLPLGPYITDIDPSVTKISLYLNGTLRQESSTSLMIFGVYQLISFISQVMTLYPGDVILTGTPSGIGAMQAGDVVEVYIEGIGRLINNVHNE